MSVEECGNMGECLGYKVLRLRATHNGKAIQKHDEMSINVSTWRIAVNEGDVIGPNVSFALLCPGSLV